MLMWAQKIATSHLLLWTMQKCEYLSFVVVLKIKQTFILGFQEFLRGLKLKMDKRGVSN